MSYFKYLLWYIVTYCSSLIMLFQQQIIKKHACIDANRTKPTKILISNIRIIEFFLSKLQEHLNSLFFYRFARWKAKKTMLKWPMVMILKINICFMRLVRQTNGRDINMELAVLLWVRIPNTSCSAISLGILRIFYEL